MKHASGWTLARIGKTVLTLIAAAIGAAVLMNSSCNLTNKAPTVPVISGPSSGVVGVAVTFRATATDPESDSVAFGFDWSDSTGPAWTGFVASGETLAVSRTFTDSGTYTVRVKTKDAEGKASGWCIPESLQVINIVRNYPDSLVGDIQLPYDDAGAAVVTADGRFLYVAYAESDFVTPVRLQDRAVLPIVRVGYVPRQMVSTPSSDHVYISCMAAHRLYALRTQDQVVDAEIPFTDSPSGLAITPDGQFIYVCLFHEERLMVVRTSDNAIVDSISLGGPPEWATVHPDGTTLYVTMGANEHLGVVDLATNTLVDSIPMGQFPQALAFTPDGKHLYVANRPDSGLAVIKTSDNTVEAHVNLHDDDLGSVAVMPDGKYVLATVRRYYGMSVVDVQTNAQIDSLPYGFGWYGVHPNGDTVYVPRVSLVHVLAKRH